MDNLRDRNDKSECPEPQSEGAVPTDAEGSQAGPVEMGSERVVTDAEDSQAGPVEMDVRQIHVAYTEPSRSIAPDSDSLDGAPVRARSL